MSTVFQVPRQDSHAACSDSVSLDQQLLKTMVLSLQRQVAVQQQQLGNSQRGTCKLSGSEGMIMLCPPEPFYLFAAD